MGPLPTQHWCNCKLQWVSDLAQSHWGKIIAFILVRPRRWNLLSFQYFCCFWFWDCYLSYWWDLSLSFFLPIMLLARRNASRGESAGWQRWQDSRLEIIHWKNKIKIKDVTLLLPQQSRATFRTCLLSNCCFSILVHFIHSHFSLLPSFWGFCLFVWHSECIVAHFHPPCKVFSYKVK